MFTPINNRNHNTRRFVAATVAGATMLIGSACTPTETSSDSVVPDVTAPVTVDTTTDVAVTDAPPVTSEPERPSTTVDRAPVPTPEPTTPPEPEPEPDPLPDPEPEPVDEVAVPSDDSNGDDSNDDDSNDDDGWDGACGPADPMPAGAEYISTTTVQFGDGVPNTATAYVYDGVWKLRIDGPVVSDEMILDTPSEGIVRVLAAAPVNDFGGEEILVRLDSIAELAMFGIFGQHDGCLFRHTTGDLGPVALTVGAHDGAMFGITCHTDEFGSFITARSAVSNDDDTWNLYGTSYTYDSPTKLEAGDGGHDFAVPTDDPRLESFTDIRCGDVPPGQF